MRAQRFPRCAPWRIVIAIACVAAFAVAGPPTGVSAAMPTGQLTVRVDCAGTPEATTIGNQTDQALDLGTWSLGSLHEPRADEPFRLAIHSGRSETLPVGAFYRYETGARAKVNVLTERELYDDTAPDEGVRLTTPFGTYTVLCSERDRTFTVPASSQCFAETGQCVEGRFLDYWRSRGLDLGDSGTSYRESLALFGHPLTAEFTQRLEGGGEYTVQYFERVRLEYHPENAAPHAVLLGQFGRRILADVAGAPVAPVPAEPGYTHFPETGHNIGPRFSAYWQGNGGLAQFGYPLTELFTERLEDGQEYQVQYFERARFEHHPENAGTPYEVLLGQFGRRILAESGR